MHEGTISENEIIVPKKINQAFISNIHCKDYLNDLQSLTISAKQQRQSGFVHTHQLIQKGADYHGRHEMAAESALKGSISFNIAGGTHHAFFNRGEGFCLLNDQVIAAKWLQNNTHVNQILILILMFIKEMEPQPCAPKKKTSILSACTAKTIIHCIKKSRM